MPNLLHDQPRMNGLIWTDVDLRLAVSGSSRTASRRWRRKSDDVMITSRLEDDVRVMSHVSRDIRPPSQGHMTYVMTYVSDW